MENPKQNTFVIGGCRSGKSRYALELAQSVPGHRKLFIATCMAQDPEMQQRVARHQQERGPDWTTAEVPLDVARAIHDNGSDVDVILVDCLTLWTTNLLMELGKSEPILDYAQQLITAVGRCPCPVILVSNEVGAGIVPENALARQFRDIMGHVNQVVAAGVHRVVWVVAGIPVTIKPGLKP